VSEEASAPYTALAHVYDKVMAEVEYEEWAQFIVRLAGERGATCESVLDLGCGTGNATYQFARLGLDVHGVDASEAMLAVARAKLPTLQFTRAGFTDFELARRFELIVSVFDSLNNLLLETDFALMAERVRDHLEPGGLFVFDVNTPSGLRDLWEGGRAEGYADDVYYRWVHTFDEATSLAHVEAYCAWPGGSFTERHTERGYDAESVTRLLRGAGFATVECLLYPDGAPAMAHSDRIWVVAQ